MEEIIKKLKAKNYRITNSRINLIKIFDENKSKHFTHEQIIKELKKKTTKINQQSVYNNLKILLNENFINQSMLGGVKIYEFSTNNNHAHFYCENCKKDFTVDYPDLFKLNHKIEEKYGFEIKNTKIEYTGLCKDCKVKNEHNK